MRKTTHPDFNRQPPHFRWKPGFHRLDRPPERLRAPNFVVDLCFLRLRRDDVDSLITRCIPRPENFTFYPCDRVAASLNFQQWTDARDAFVCLWESRLSGNHDFTPELSSKVLLPSDRVELDGRLRSLFASHVKGLMEGKEVKRWVEEREKLSKEIAHVSKSLRNPLPIGVFPQQLEKKKGLEVEKDLVERRIKEFESAMRCILQYLENNDMEEGEGFVPIFRFDGSLDWKHIQSLIIRERRRLEEGLPIYAYRRDILRQIHYQQVIFPYYNFGHKFQFFWAVVLTSCIYR